MENSILHGGEKELLELKQILQEKNHYNVVLDSMDTGIEELKKKIDDRKLEIEKEMNLEILRRRDLVGKSFQDDMDACDAEIKNAQNVRNGRRQELIDQMIQDEGVIYEKRKENLEVQMKLVSQEEGIPWLCTTRLFLAFFCPRTGMDALILTIGILLLLLVLPMVIYFGAYGGNNPQALTAIYLVLIIIFYTLYLLINNLVKDKYLAGINKLLKLIAESKKLDKDRKQRIKELESLPESSFDLSEFDEEMQTLEERKRELAEQKEIAIANFDRDENLQLSIAQEIQEKFKAEIEKMKAELDEKIRAYEEMQEEYNNFLDEKAIEQKYEILLRVEPDIFSQSVIDELIFFLQHGDAENISKAVMKRKKKLGQDPIPL